MTVLLGGRAAEQLVFGVDHHRRRRRPASAWTRSAAAMVHDYGMGSALSRRARSGPTAIAVRHDAAAARPGAAGAADEAQRRARELISGHREQLDALAESLLANEVLERDEIDRHDGRGQRSAIARASTGAAASAAATEPEPSRARRDSRLPAACSAQIDHIGVAVEDLDAALAPLRRARSAMRLQHRETVERAGRRGRAARRRRGPRRAAVAARSRNARREVPRAARTRACTTSPTGRRHRRRARGAARAPGSRLIDETPRAGIRARGSRSCTRSDRRRPHRDRRARGED